MKRWSGNDYSEAWSSGVRFGSRFDLFVHNNLYESACVSVNIDESWLPVSLRVCATVKTQIYKEDFIVIDWIELLVKQFS